MEPLGAFTAREREDEAGKRNRGRESVVKSERASERASKKKKNLAPCMPDTFLFAVLKKKKEACRKLPVPRGSRPSESDVDARSNALAAPVRLEEGAA